MENKKIIIIVVLGILILAIIGIGIYYLINRNFNFTKAIINQVTNNTGTPKDGPIVQEAISPQEIEAKNKSNYSNTITGTITFSKSTGSAVKATIKASDGEEYVLSPEQPEAIYGSFGVKNGDKVQIQGKFIENNKIEWIKIKSI